LRRWAAEWRNTLRYCALRIDIAPQTADCPAMRRLHAVTKAKASYIRGPAIIRLR
jgi:hypothetical protein